MARIVNKLNLNKVPELVDNNSLIFAKNVRLSTNGFSPDFGFDDLNLNFGNFRIVGIIPYNTSFYIFLNDGTTSEIRVYNEKTKECTKVNCNWHWSGGTIDGTVTINLNGDTLLTVAEHFDNKSNVPIKTIQIPNASIYDDESIYTQAPKVPLINLICTSTYKNVIPAGVYQFFIRYEIRDNFYTNWFPASKELFTGVIKNRLTQQGGLRFADLTIDSDTSFNLKVDYVKDALDAQGSYIYKSFQLGFIISHDDEVYARAYKHYAMGTSQIDFDYDTEYIEEIDIREILESPFNLYNVKNVTSFKNKLYISNYIESDFNPTISLDPYIKSIGIDLRQKVNESKDDYAGQNVTFETHNGHKFITEITSELPSGEVTRSISNILEAILCKPKWTSWIDDTSAVGGFTNTASDPAGIVVVFEKYIPEDPIDPVTGEVIVIDDEPVDPNETRVYTIYTEEPTAFNIIETTNLNSGLQTIAQSIVGVHVNTGNFVTAFENLKHSKFVIKYKYTKNVHGEYFEKEAVITLDFKINITNIHIDYTLENNYTLIPHQQYNFYIHFVRENGETTNGYLINDTPKEIPEPEGEFGNNDLPAIYPVFIFPDGYTLPVGYVACFISILHVKNKVAQVFDIRQEAIINKVNNETVEGRIFVGDCLELDTRLYTMLNDIPALNGDDKYLIDYKASYDNEYAPTFGASGKCLVSSNQENLEVTTDLKRVFIVIPYTNNPEYAQLIKCTPFFTEASLNTENEYDNYDGLNLPGYLCRVKKPLSNFNKYFSGSEFYDKYTPFDENLQDYIIHLDPWGEHDLRWKTYYDSEEFTIYSNYNLNYVSLTNDIVPRVYTKDFTENENNEDKESFLLYATDSINLSEVYELKSMYYSYTRKVYYPFDLNNVQIKFDNTIRSSELKGDEEIINMFKFKAADYYNVPTDKGIIINLVAVGDNILVHNQDSIYKFTGSNSLSATGGENIQMKESEPFDTGIQELFGSEFGYAGLQNKRHQILSEMGYTFYDSDSRRIYMYTGNANIKVISNDISKLIKRKEITNIYFADDYYNNRMFISILFKDNKVATLSYDFTVKSFISLHDFKFSWAFKTKTKCYFIYTNPNPVSTENPFIQEPNNKIYQVSESIDNQYGSLQFNDTLYPSFNNFDPDNHNNGKLGKACIIDVIYNNNFEQIKTCNAISWICNLVKDFSEEPTNDINTLMVAEESYNGKYKGDYLRIYTDSCSTDRIDIKNTSNNYRLINNGSVVDNSYKDVRYNLGKWTFNYFRNILHNVNNYNSPADSQSLIYGKYIVARFIFPHHIAFKIEDVTFNTDNQYNV